MHLHIRELLRDPVSKELYGIIYEHSSNHGHLILSVIALYAAPLFIKLIYEQSHHAHTIFKLDKAIIPISLREIPASIYIPFITCLDKMCAMLFKCLFLKMFYYINNLAGVLSVERFKMEQAISVI